LNPKQLILLGSNLSQRQAPRGLLADLPFSTGQAGEGRVAFLLSERKALAASCRAVHQKNK